MVDNDHNAPGRSAGEQQAGGEESFVMPEWDSGDVGIPAPGAGADYGADGSSPPPAGVDLTAQGLNTRLQAQVGGGPESEAPFTAGDDLANSGTSLKFKLVGSLVLLTLIVLIIGAASLTSLLEINTISFGIATRHAKLARINEEIKTTVLRIHDAGKDFLIAEDEEALDRSERYTAKLRNQLATATQIGESIERETGISFGAQYVSLADSAEQYQLQFTQQSKNIREARENITEDIELALEFKGRLADEMETIRRRVKTLVDDYWIVAKQERAGTIANRRAAEGFGGASGDLSAGVEITNLDRDLLDIQIVIARYLQTEQVNFANAADVLINGALNQADKIRRSALSEKIVLAMNETHKALTFYKGMFKDAKDSIDSVRANRARIDQRVDEQKSELRQTAQNLLALATGISDKAWGSIVSESVKLNKAAKRAWIISLIAALAGTVTGFIVLYFVPRPILATINELVAGARRVAAGDLTKPIAVTSTDELGQLAIAFNHMRTSLLVLVERIQRASVQIATTVNEIQAAANQQSMTSREQLGSLNEFGVALREIAQTSQKLATTADTMASDAKDVADMVDQNNSKSSQALGSMDVIGNATKQTSDRIKALNDQMDSINDAVSTINGVADVTTLLSLNAAIEANKAGEMGKGFSVVATEIRRLSDRSIDSADSIAGMVRDIQRATESSVMSMDKSSEEIRIGVTLVRETTDNLQAINQRMATIRAETTNLAEGASEQAEACTGARSTVGDLQTSANLAAQAARQTSAASYELTAMASQLTAAVSAFRI